MISSTYTPAISESFSLAFLRKIHGSAFHSSIPINSIKYLTSNILHSLPACYRLYRDGAGTDTGVKGSERTQDGSGDGNGDRVVKGTEVETRG